MKKLLNEYVRVAFWFILAIMAAGSLGAQETRGTLAGRVVDPTGSAMPNVVVEATNVATNTTASSTSNDQGDYLLPYLISGTYNITAKASGFKTFLRSGIEIRISDRLRVDITMEIGEQSERVTVTAETPMLETTSSSVGQVIEQRWISDLPVLHGNQMLLTQLSPGVVMTVSGGLTWVSTSAGANARNTEYGMAGSPSSTQEISLDGASDTTTVAGNSAGKRTVAYIPPSDLVAEFKVQTAAFDASVGNSTGGWVSTSLKSGTNTLHGTAMYSRTNVGWNANDFFANRSGLARTDLHSNHQVITGSGPIYLPKLYDGRNRTFFLYGWEREMRSAPFSNTTFSVPTAKQREGDFSELLKVSSSYQIYNPFSAYRSNGRVCREPFANNIVPTSLFGPVAKKILSYYPLPLVSGEADGTNNYPQPGLVSVVTMKSHTVRIDHNVSDRDRMFVRAYYGDRPAILMDYFNNLSTGYTQSFANRGVMFDNVYTVSPSVVIGMRYAFTRFFWPNAPKSEGMDLATLGFPSSLVNQISTKFASFPAISINGLQSIGGNGGFGYFTNTHQLGGEITWVKGQHTLQFGVDHRRYQYNSHDNAVSPTLTFSTTYTKGPADNSTGSPSGLGQGLASFLLGIPTSGNIKRTSDSSQSSPITGLFVQDNWRVTNKLTLNLGVRYEVEGALSERFDRTVRGFDTTTVNSMNGQVSANYAASPLAELPASQFVVRGGLLYAGVSGQPHSLYDTPKKNFAPRAGFAYQITNDTVIRGGYGMFYGFTGQQSGTAAILTGFSRTTTYVPSLDGGLTFAASLDNPFPSGISEPTGSSLGLDTNIGNGVSFLNSNPKTPFNQIWSVTIQRTLPGRSFLELGYIGNRGSDIRLSSSPQYFDAKYLSRKTVRDQDTINYWTTTVSNPFYPLLSGTNLAAKVVTRDRLLRMANYPQFSGVSTTENTGSSWYHAMTARFQKRFGSGFTANANFTRSKLIQATSRLNGQTSPLERVIGSDDRPYTFTFNGIYEFPFGDGKMFPIQNRIARAIAGGWQIGAIFTAQGGPALGFGNALLTGTLSDIPLSGDERTIDRWVNTSAFNRTSSQQLSYNYVTLSSRLSGVRAPGLNLWNGTLMKTVTVAERFRVQLKADVANMFNHPNFASPNTSPTSTAFGKITAMYSYSRIIQLGAKVLW